jgi:hypothetical protein
MFAAYLHGLHVSQLFRWRKELCNHGETSIAPLVPVEIGPSVPPRDVAEAPLTTAPARRGPQLLATILFDKFGMHIPLNRQSARFKCEGIGLPLSTLADQVGHGTFAVMPIFHLIERHVLAAERLHGDDTTIRILAKGKCTTGRIWTYVRDDRPFAGPAPPAAVYYASSDRRGEHPQKHLAAFDG